MKQTRHFIKILSVGSGFVVFGIICMMGNIILLPIMMIKQEKHKFVQKFTRFFIRHMWFLFLKYLALIRYVTYTFEGFENIEKKSNLIIANHPSLLDVVFLLSYIKDANCIVKAELKKNIFLYPAIKCSGYILNTQNEEFLQNGINALKNGESVIIFPEGTRTKERILFHKGATYMGLKGAKYITPIIIFMKPRSLTKGQKWYNTPREIIKYVFRAEKTIKTEEILKNRPLPAVARELNKNLIQLYEKELYYGRA